MLRIGFSIATTLGLVALAIASASAQPQYISDKQISTDCGIDYAQDPPPGFARRPGQGPQNMPPPITDALSVGADRPVAETDHDRVYPGVVMIEPNFRFTKLFIDEDGEVAGAITDDRLGFSKPMDDGTRIVNGHIYSDYFNDGGGTRGCLEEYGADGELNWRLRLATDDYVQHHDFVKLPNGNFLTIIWERVSTEQAIMMGRDADGVADNGDFWFDGIIEIDPETATIVWEWSSKYHLIQDRDPGKINFGVVADHPELLDINRFNRRPDGSVESDWTHFNAIQYNEELDQIAVSSNYLSEIYIIDHSTTPFESHQHSGGRYGKGGDFLYRWGNPTNYHHGTEDDEQLFNQHDVQWIAEGMPGAGNLLIFNNGRAPVRPWSTVVEIAPVMEDDGSYTLSRRGDYENTEVVWEYDPDGDERFFSFFISGTQRLPNGNTLVNAGAGARVREVTREGDIVWEYRYEEPDGVPHMLFRANKYPKNHPAIRGILRQ
jgi:hypothetical protein